MTRRPRGSTAHRVVHVLNRAARGALLFLDGYDYLAFEGLMGEAQRRVNLRLLVYCLMPTHFHIVMWPTGDGQMSDYMRWLSVTHTTRWHAQRRSTGTCPVFQGRFKSFAVEGDDHFLRVCRYVERNPVRAGLCERAEQWRWSSLGAECEKRTTVALSLWPIPRPADWLDRVNAQQSALEVAAIRRRIVRGT